TWENIGGTQSCWNGGGTALHVGADDSLYFAGADCRGAAAGEYGATGALLAKFAPDGSPVWSFYSDPGGANHSDQFEDMVADAACGQLLVLQAAGEGLSYVRRFAQ